MDSHAGKGSFNNHPLQLLKNLKEDMNNIAVMWPFRDYYVKRLQVGSGCHMIWLQEVQILGKCVMMVVW
jgi:hypothetical protein